MKKINEKLKKIKQDYIEVQDSLDNEGTPQLFLDFAYLSLKDMLDASIIEDNYEAYRAQKLISELQSLISELK